MTLGKYHLGELVDKFDGSYIMAAAGYNAGPSRMQTWVDTCGDPRGVAADPLSFIECHPFTETRNYMMRVTENMRVYRARLNGGTAPLTAMADVQRGFPGPIGPFTGPEFSDVASPDAPISYADYNKGITTNAAAATQLTGTTIAPAPTTMAPVPNPPVSMKPVPNPVVKAEPAKTKTTAKAAKKKKAESVKKKKSTKKKRD